MLQRFGKLALRSTVVVFFAAWACAPGSGAGCGSCTGNAFVYPKNDAGKAPIPNAAQVRINQAALDWIQNHLGDVFESVCCPTDPASSVPAAQQCYGKAACYTDIENGVKLMHFYLGSPGAPIALGGGVNIRNGDEYPDEAVNDSKGPGDPDDITGNDATRPYCNDVGGKVCERERQNRDSFCRPSSTSGCNNPNPSDPSQRDYCCGDKEHGHEVTGCWPWEHCPGEVLDICHKDGGGNYDRRPLPRCQGYPSNAILRLDQLKNIKLSVLPATATLPAGVRISVDGLNIGIDSDIEVDNIASASVTCFAKDKDPSLGTIENAAISMDVRPEFVRLAPDQPEILQLGSNQITVNSFDLPTLHAPSIQTDAYDPECQDENWEPDGLFYVAADEECNIGCGVAGFAGSAISGIFNGVSGLAGLLQGPISSAIGGAIAGQLNGTPVEIATQIDARRMLDSTIALRWGKKLGVLAAAHGDGLVVSGAGPAQGLVAGLDLGTESDREVCVAALPAPAVPQVNDPQLPPTITVVDNTQTPPANRTDTYHVAAAIAQPALQRVFYNLFNSGLLCVGLGTEDIAKLSGGSQTITAGLLFLLAPELERLADASAPIYVQLEPHQIPTVVLGSGKATGQVDANGKATVDSLIQVGIHELGLSFYVFAQDRYIRVFTVNTDLDLGLSILRGANNGLELSIDSIAANNVVDTFNALSATDYSSVVKVVLNLVSSTLLSNKLTFNLNFDSALKAALGPNVYMRINDVQRSGVNNDYLAAYLTMCTLGDPTNQAVCADGGVPARDLAAPVLSDALPLYVRPAQPLPPSLRTSTVPAGALALHVEDGGAAREWAVRVDTGVYQSLQRANARGDIVVDSPQLLVLGKHTLQVVSQAAGHYETLSEPQEVFVELDSERPLAMVDRAEDGLIVSAKDLVSAPQEIHLELRTVGENGQSRWRPSMQGETLGAAALAGVYNVEVRATDHAGNVSDVTTYNWAHPPQITAAQGCGCHTTGSGDASFLVFALAFFFIRRSRRAR